MTAAAGVADWVPARWQLVFTGNVQGVGFRPFLWRLAQEYGASGWVENTRQGVVAELEAPEAQLRELLERCRREAPGQIDRCDVHLREAQYATSFQIRQAQTLTADEAMPLSPDLAPCGACLQEFNDPRSRFYQYPFIACTDCGPRVSLTRALPFERCNTSMAAFALCAACEQDYADPTNRRFHAELISCPVCGPRLCWTDAGVDACSAEQPPRTPGEAVSDAVSALRQGKIIAAQSVAGFHLLLDARNDAAVQRLRERKRRPHKPFAVLAPDLHWVRRHCRLSAREEAALISPERPIVLLELRKPRAVADSVAPHNPLLGVMLPPSPVHALLLQAVQGPLVATSGNRSGEPMVTDPTQAQSVLAGVADGFLSHNRAIVHSADDSVLRLIGDRMVPLRRARGRVPRPLTLPENRHAHRPVIGSGGQLKAASARAWGHQVWLSPPAGDLDNPTARQHWKQGVQQLLGSAPGEAPGSPSPVLAHDAHPGYFSSQCAAELCAQTHAVQHHRAHIAACMLDNGLDGPVLGVAWDGTGYGDDGRIWGGEFLHVDGPHTERVAHLRAIRLPGGEAAIRDPRRVAMAMAEEVGRFDSLANRLQLSSLEARTWEQMLQGDRHCPAASSIGRLFDGVAVWLGLVTGVSFEGQAAMALEFAAMQAGRARGTETETKTDGPEYVLPQVGKELDWRGLIAAMDDDLQDGVPVSSIAAAFHRALVQGICSVVETAKLENVVLSGGCFQNKFLSEAAVAAIAQRGRQAYWHRRLPPNDGSLAVGQIMDYLLREEKA